MKYLKRFEWLKRDFEIGDYVISEENGVETGVAKFISANIGQIINIKTANDITYYYVKYENIPNVLYYNFSYDGHNDVRPMLEFEIKEWGKTKEEVEQKISANKYNL